VSFTIRRSQPSPTRLPQAYVVKVTLVLTRALEGSGVVETAEVRMLEGELAAGMKKLDASEDVV